MKCRVLRAVSAAAFFLIGVISAGAPRGVAVGSPGPALQVSTADTVFLADQAGVGMDRMEAMSVRRSVRQFQSLPVPDEKLSWLLRAARCAWQEADAPGRMIVVRENRAYEYDPALHALIHEPDSLVRRFGSEAPVTVTLSPRIGEADRVTRTFGPVTPIDETETDSLWVWRGAAGQALYLGAAALGLGTVTRGGVRFPVGLPGDTIRPPQIRRLRSENPAAGPAGVPLESALRKAAGPVPEAKQDALLAKLTWAMYGRSGIAFSDGRMHRTVASARNRYPMTLYALTGAGVSMYDPEADRLTAVPDSASLKRIAEAAAFPALLEGPFGFLISWDRPKMDNRGCALYEAGSMLFDCRLILNPLGADASWKVVSDPGAIQPLIPGTPGEPFFLIAVGPRKTNPETSPEAKPETNPETNPGTNPEKRTGVLKDGRYTAESPGWTGMKVSVRVAGGKIEAVEVLKARGSAHFYGRVVQGMPSRIVANGGPEIEAVTGATLSSTALKVAVRSALEQARRNGT